MKKFLLASHGAFAAGILDALEYIMGRVEGIEALCAYVDPSEDLPALVRNYVKNIPKGDELIVVSDLFGGSVNSEFMRHVGAPGFHLVAGLNLPLLIELVSNRDLESGEMIQNALEVSGMNIQCCDDLLRERREARADWQAEDGEGI